jgi:hypothetical protein
MTPPLAAAESVYWHFPVLIVTVSLVYSATRFERWDQILKEALFWGLRMTGFLVAIGVALYLVTVLDPRLCLALLGVGVAVFIVLSLRSRGSPHP